MKGTLPWYAWFLFWALIFGSIYNYAFAHVNADHPYYCKDGLLIHEWQIDKNGDGKADGVKFYLEGELEPYAEIYANEKNEATGGRVLNQYYDSLADMQKVWPSICHAARYVIKKRGLQL